MTDSVTFSSDVLTDGEDVEPGTRKVMRNFGGDFNMSRLQEPYGLI